jgi:hypothetical protein
MKITGKLLLAILLWSIAFPLNTLATRIIPPDHDWTVFINGHYFGFTGYSAQTLGGAPATYVSYGWGSWEIGLPIHIVVALVALFAVILAYGVVFIFRRFRNHDLTNLKQYV